MIAPQAATFFELWAMLTEQCSGAGTIMQAEMKRDIISAPSLRSFTLAIGRPWLLGVGLKCDPSVTFMHADARDTSCQLLWRSMLQLLMQPECLANISNCFKCDCQSFAKMVTYLC